MIRKEELGLDQKKKNRKLGKLQNRVHPPNYEYLTKSGPPAELRILKTMLILSKRYYKALQFPTINISILN